MGVAELGTLQAKLIAHGRAPSTPFALVENGSRASQRVVTGSLASLVECATSHAVQSPALLILGEVAALATSLAWFGATPLGATVLGIHVSNPGGPPAEVLAAVHRA